MSYLEFLLRALLPPVLVLALTMYRMRRMILVGSAMRAVLYLIVIAVAYTTPWDNYLIYRGVWWYGAERVLGVIGFVPVEEYAFMALQAVMTGLFTVFVYAPASRSSAGSRLGASHFALGMALWIGASLMGVTMLLSRLDAFLYLGLITSWAGPVLAGTWWLGRRECCGGRWRYVAAVGIPTLYLWAWDAFAINEGIWAISETFTTGVKIGWLPVEEAVFFLVTNALVVQGVLLFWDQRTP